MTKKIKKPFSADAWKNGAEVEMKCGCKVRILCVNMDADNSIVGIWKHPEGGEAVATWFPDGRYSETSDDERDLVIV